MVSIILCTYNRAHTLRATIDSILRQTYTEFELLIIDDGSTDNTQELLRCYKDVRVRVFALSENSYYCAAANYGIEKAKGEYIAFATSDDLWDSGKLEKQIGYMEKRKECGACFTFADIIDEQGENAQERYPQLAAVFRKNYYTRRGWVQRLIFEGNCLCHPSSVIRREVLESVGGYHLYYGHLADLELWLRIIRFYPIHVVEEPLVSYRYFENAEDQISGASEEKVTRSLNEHMIIRRNFINDLTDEEMMDFFEDRFQYKEACTHRELEIEKAFLLMHCISDLPDLWVLGMEKLETLVEDPETLQVLKDTYHIRLQDIYKWNFQHFYMDYGIHNRFAQKDQEIIHLQEKLKKLDRHTHALDKERKELNELLAVQREENKNQEKTILELTTELEEGKEQLLKMNQTLSEKEKALDAARRENEEKTVLLNQALLERLKRKERWKRI